MKRLLNKLTENHKKQENLKLSNQENFFSLKPLISIEGCWMIGLTSLEVHISFFNIAEEKKTNSNTIQMISMIFHFQKRKMSLRRSLNFQKLHPSIDKINY